MHPVAGSTHRHCLARKYGVLTTLITSSHRHHAKKLQAGEAKEYLPSLPGDVRAHDHDQASSDSDSSRALHNLERILTSKSHAEHDEAVTPTEIRKGSAISQRKPIRKVSKLARKKSSICGMSESDAKDEALVPSAEAVLDNTNTLAYNCSHNTPAWLYFKQEIVRLTHTLKIRRWKRLPIEQSQGIEVSRLSGALTNAVYVVSPPVDFKNPNSDGRPPRKLLLRIYGPQAEHLIDRENELQILRRLAQKQIGPTLLGTFNNGRFEEFFHARTLEAEDLRVPETSKQIAKRMRELHDGIALLKEERNAGASVWKYWDKWKERCEEVITWLDHQILESTNQSSKLNRPAWMEKGLICGVEWAVFRGAVRKYRDWLYEQYGGEDKIRDELIFAHNDTQYGNLMRLEPEGESPLLKPENSHKQLQVIDFEYAAPNVPGLEFANHFTEWCYNYHSETKPYALHEKLYPSVEEQHRFLRAYVQHTPPIQTRQFSTPPRIPARAPSSSISTFVLDSRAPPMPYAEEERKRDQQLETEVKRLQHESQIWRVANSAQWVAWGIVQAKVPGMDEALEAQRNVTPTPEASQTVVGAEGQVDERCDELSNPMAGLTLEINEQKADPSEARNGEQASEVEAPEQEEEFDYLGYAQERALFFWGDVLRLGIMTPGELPEDLLRKAKTVEH
ncbi:uncharacterized protein KY384_006506 [Bacidia gigantensis]|uniref:uncharacterized protein n=1 Tax=Bacidia gigantensis TaxID=2732470 RepID=UPI001D04CFFD|nr:uncharacterized protein KY384_006506 [Bacidia gigantensis]KAG8528817.1 hypothetical protein KY384_006506 [Bacidia gigantensis]